MKNCRPGGLGLKIPNNSEAIYEQFPSQKKRKESCCIHLGAWNGRSGKKLMCWNTFGMSGTIKIDDTKKK